MSETTWTLHLGHALDVLKTLPAESVHCIVTSPPYFGLRDYGVDGQIGLEPSPDEFVAALVEVFAEARRVLRDEGTCWLNLGDSYAATTKGSSGKGEKQITNAGTIIADRRWSVPNGMKAKDLIGIPWLSAFALRADGWYLRSDIIWHKPNPMPESVTDRPTKAHEYVFLLTKAQRYYYDADAIREPVPPGAVFKPRRDDGSTLRAMVDPSGVMLDGLVSAGANPNGANARTVWPIATEPSSYAHFALMPSRLARRCITAGCPHGGVVLDPFAGMATTGVVALEEGRSFVGIELNETYHAQARERLAGTMPLFAAEAPAESAVSRQALIELTTD